jgi:hypothetical protein
MRDGATVQDVDHVAERAGDLDDAAEENEALVDHRYDASTAYGRAQGGDAPGRNGRG